MKKHNLIILLLACFAYPNASFIHAKNKLDEKLIQGRSGSKAVVYTTGADIKMQKSESEPFAKGEQPTEFTPWIFIDTKNQFETFLGIGGAITDAVAETFAKLTEEKQREFLKAYYDVNEGIGYSVVRTNMNSCDFSSFSYTYVSDNDTELKTFNISQDEKYKLPLIKKAQQIIAKNEFLFYFSPWSPPAWMKTNNDMKQGGALKTEFYQAWANYFIKFTQSYEDRGVPVWGMTMQNESMATQRWESCVYEPEQARDFVKNYLGPTLTKNGMKDKKLIVWDHNRDLAYHYSSIILNDPDAAKYVWGTGFHWYEIYASKDQRWENLRLLKNAFPDKGLAFTEGCPEGFDRNNIMDIKLGERYADNILNDLNCGTTIWTDWNIMLNEQGGPNHVGNYCYAPVHAMDNGNLAFTYMYYYIGHFSKFIRPGAKRVVASSNRADVQTTAFVNPDGKLVVVILNKSDEEYELGLWIDGAQSQTKSKPHTISTWIL